MPELVRFAATISYIDRTYSTGYKLSASTWTEQGFRNALRQIITEPGLELSWVEVGGRIHYAADVNLRSLGVAERR